MRASILVLLLCTLPAASGDLGVEPSGRLLYRTSTLPIHSSPLLRSLNSEGVSEARCCKVCTKGKPCGDTCIAQDKTCHVGSGCAC
jgi:hypothetical protein